MMKTNARTKISVRLFVGALSLLLFTESAWAIFGVWRRTAVRTAVVVSATESNANANAAAAANANAEAAAAQQAAASSAASAAAAQQAAAQVTQKSPQQQLQELKSLYDQKLISASDYEAAKQKILSAM